MKKYLLQSNEVAYHSKANLFEAIYAFDFNKLECLSLPDSFIVFIRSSTATTVSIIVRQNDTQHNDFQYDDKQKTTLSIMS